jgi:hypothetical protein
MLNDVEALLLAKGIKADRDAVAPGEYVIDTIVHVQGTLTVAEDPQPKVPTVSIPLKEVLALFIARSGATRESSLKLLRECMSIALATGTKGVGAVEAAADIDEVFKAEVDRLTAALPRTPVRGACRVKGLTVTRL